MTILFDQRQDHEPLTGDAAHALIAPLAPKTASAPSWPAFLDWRVLMLLLGVLLTLAWAGAWVWGLVLLVRAIF